MARKSNLLIVCVMLSVVLVGCSINANTSAETIPLNTTTVVLTCAPPKHLDCANADLSGTNLIGADLSGANLTGATMPDGTIHD